MAIFEHSLACHSVWHFPFQFHHELQHLVVGLASKEDLSAVEFEEGAAHCPHVNGIVVLATHDYEMKKYTHALLRCNHIRNSGTRNSEIGQSS